MSSFNNKFALSLLLTLVAATCAAFAGPEDRQKSTCFVAERADAVAPQTLCILDGWLSVSGPNRTLTLVQPNGNWDLVFKVTTVRSADGHRFAYQASKLLLNRAEAGCGESGKVDLFVEFEASNSSQYIDPSRFTLRAIRTSKADICHSAPQVETIEYRAQ